MATLWPSFEQMLLLVAKVGGDLLAGAKVQLLEYVGDMVMHRMLGEHQFGGDPAAGQSSRPLGSSGVCWTGSLSGSLTLKSLAAFKASSWAPATHAIPSKLSRS